jgi:hypothetical protein
MAGPAHDFDALPTDARAPTFRQELRVVLVVLAFLAVVEGVARVLAPSLDYDRKHIHAFPQIIGNFNDRAKAASHPKVLFFGNSLMLHGLDEQQFKDELAKDSGAEVETAKITPVGTAVLDWLYLYRRYFDAPGSDPDVLVVGFVAHHIHDQEPAKLPRLARHFTASRDLPVLWRDDLPYFHDRVQSLLCAESALCGDQPEHQMSILYACVSNYQEGLKTNNRLVEAAAKRKAVQQTQTETFSRLNRFIQLCKSRGVKVIFVPMPQPEPWKVAPEALALIKQHGMEVRDATSIPGMTEADFSDGYHLGDTGKVKFSRWLAGALSKGLTHHP